MKNNKKVHESIAEAFGRTTDPLAEYNTRFKNLDADPFDLWLQEQIYSQDYAQGTVEMNKRRIDQWRKYMQNETDRHPAVPTTHHVIDFARYYLDEHDNSKNTVKAKLGTLSRAFQYFQNEPAFPHPTDFNPFNVAKGKIDLNGEDSKPHHPIPLEEFRNIIRDDIKHIRDRALIIIQPKLGLRASEVSNIKLSEIHISNSELQEHYDNLGTHSALEGRPNAVYIPHDRKRNKSDRPRVLPLDDELRRVLLQYLLCRPDNGRPWLFLSKSGGKKLDQDNINDVWKKYFRPEYGPTERYRGVSSHYGRHYFTTWFRIEREWPRDLIKYMRGDRQSGGEIRSNRDAIDSYIHTWYEDIEDRYRQEIYKLRI
jgi:integrase/recombinase XerD